MATFEQIFPTFLGKCAELHDLLQTVAFVLFIVGLITYVAHGFRLRSFFRFLIRLLILTALLVFLPSWGNSLQSLLQTSILSGLGVDPTSVHDQYLSLLELKRGEPGENSWLSLWTHAAEFAVEKLIWAVLWLLSYLVSYILWWAYVLQKVLLHMGYALSPLMIGFMAIHPLRHLGTRFLTNLFGVLLWPLGWAIAALVTQGILDFMSDPSFKFVDPTAVLFTLQNTVGVAVLAFWVAFSTFAAPWAIQRMVATGATAGELLGAAAQTLIQSASTATGAAAASLAAGRGLAGAAATGAAVGALALPSAATGVGNVGAVLLGAGAMSLKPAKGDITGDAAAKAVIHRNRNPHSP